jgi:hypothetical protein
MSLQDRIDVHRAVWPCNWAKALPIVLLALACLPTVANAQDPQLGIQDFTRVNLALPPVGARSMALGGTGIGMPDDASAAALNPAAMRLLVRPEVSGTFRLHQARFLEISNPTLPVGFRPDDITMARFGGGRREEVAIAVAAPAGRLAAGGFYVGGESSGVQRAGGSVAYSVLPTLSIGGGLVINIVNAGFGYCRDQITPSPDFSCPVATGGSVRNHDEGRDVDIRYGFQIGASWSPTPRVSFGLVHRRGTDHPFTTSIYMAGQRGPTSTTELHIPDQTGAGVGLRVTELFRVFVDATQVRHSQAEPAILSALRPITDDLSPFSMADGTELRGGAEYTIPFRDNSITLRGGFWREPAPGVRYDGDNPFWRVLLPNNPAAVLHRTGGVGFGNRRFEVAVGVDFADSIRALACGGVARF